MQLLQFLIAECTSAITASDVLILKVLVCDPTGLAQVSNSVNNQKRLRRLLI